MANFYLGTLPSGQVVSRSSTRPDFTHAATVPGSDRIPSFGTSRDGAIKNAQSSFSQKRWGEIEVCPVRLVQPKEYRAALALAKAGA
jgi:hypothetical protein